MSRYYTILRQATIGSQRGAVDQVLARLAATQPRRAEALRKVNWSAVRAQIAREAIAQVMASHHTTLRPAGVQAAWRTEGGEQPEGECVGVVDAGGTSVGLFLTEDRIALAWAASHYAHDMQRETAERNAKRAKMPDAVVVLQRDLKAAYQEREVAALMRIAAGEQNVYREELPDGSVLLRVAVKGGAS